jgi:hypothetical protein
MKNPWITYLPVFICVVLTSFFVYFPITDSDIFWHLAAGREMIARKHFIYTDPFAYTLASPRWIDLHWLFQLLMYGLYSAGGERMLILFKMFMVSGVAALLCLTHRSSRYVFFSAVFSSFLFYEVRYLIDIRPVLITMFCMAAYLFLFENARQKNQAAFLWLCIPLQIIWTNSQGLYAVGLFIIGAYWMESVALFFRHKNNNAAMETVLLLLCTASCLINPYGLAGVRLPFELFSRITPTANNIYSMNISENVPLFSLTGFETVYRTAVIVTAIIASLLFIINWKKIRIAQVILFIGFLLLALSAVRNVLLYIIIVIPIIGYHAASLDIWSRLMTLPLKYRRFFSFAGYLVVLTMLIVLLFRHATIVAACPPHRTLSPFRFPEKITEYIIRNPIPGNMFNDIRYGGYLMWHLYPEKKVFIDTRLVIRPPEFFAEYLAISDHPELFAAVAKKFNITYAIVPSALFTRHLKLIQWLYNSDDWHIAFTDGASVIFVRNDIFNYPRLDMTNDSTVRNIADSINVQWKDAPAVRCEALVYFAGLLQTLGLPNTYHLNVSQIKP